ncbi:hypothetical protein [Spirosoma radiotolerans]|uniref:Uncharacterized protein n=1 Tax=Spirosoma radiotolerans TaxID=1379870 RepID=A0A0E4A0W6_9BACT|nr:hypothetical protein [Spirosoma radiotolerans]AKD58362.1 hypothetical protein SD10_06150 [Spirosoma radiotolerans]
MAQKNITEQVQHEAKVVQGEETKDKVYASEHTFPDPVSAQEAFGRSVEKLLNVNGWSGLSMFTADFVLHDQAGKPREGGSPQVGDYIQIILPGPMPENWVQVVDTATDENRVEFTVQPGKDPRNKQSDEVEHFFHAEASSTFRVELVGNTITASEIGKHEGINNEGPEAGNRALINTVIAEGGWLFYQKFQWKLLTDYLVHL